MRPPPSEQKNISLKYLRLPKNHFKTNLFFLQLKYLKCAFEFGKTMKIWPPTLLSKSPNFEFWTFWFLELTPPPFGLFPLVTFFFLMLPLFQGGACQCSSGIQKQDSFKQVLECWTFSWSSWNRYNLQKHEEKWNSLKAQEIQATTGRVCQKETKWIKVFWYPEFREYRWKSGCWVLTTHYCTGKRV